PECEPGQFTPVMHEATSLHPYIEFGNRLLAVVLVLLAVGALWVVWRDTTSTRWLRFLAVVPLVGVLAQAVIGGMAVLVELHPAVVGSHFLVSILLVVASTVLLLRHRDRSTSRSWTVRGRPRALVLALIPVSAVVLALGTVVTGAGPHSGDEDAPYRYAVDPLLMTRVHALAVWLYLALLAVIWLELRRAVRAGDGTLAPGLSRTSALLVIALAQGGVGYLQHFLGLPEVLVGVHMLGAALTAAVQSAQVVALRPADAGGG
ncbi:MAG TPA: COX15/CtaA family protein, partial [Actinotalea sp.]|nr:COX15/CtaA family protein [Actinotalea sp.]